MEPIGRRRWAIAEGYIPGWSHGPEPQMTSHEVACFLNTADSDAHVEITIFYTDREPVGPYRVTVPARRTLHLRFNELRDPEPIPKDTPYASIIESECAGRGAAHAAGLAAGGERADHHDRLPRSRLSEARGMTGSARRLSPWQRSI